MPSRPKFTLTYKHEPTVALMAQVDHRTLAIWALECAARVLPLFEERFSADERPRQALAALQAWIDSGVFSMAAIRKASLDAHAAARAVGEDNAARSAARAAGQAVATAHVRTHAYGAALYALQAIHRLSGEADAATAVAGEEAWQYRRLEELAAGGGTF